MVLDGRSNCLIHIAKYYSGLVFEYEEFILELRGRLEKPHYLADPGPGNREFPGDGSEWMVTGGGRYPPVVCR